MKKLLMKIKLVQSSVFRRFRIDELIGEVKRDRLGFVSAYLSYSLLLAVFPFVISLISLFGVLDIETGLIQTGLKKGFPDVLNIFFEEISRASSTGVVAVSLLVSINAASAGIRAVMKSINACYSFDYKRGFIKNMVYSFAAVLMITLSLALSVSVFIFGGTIRACFSDTPAVRLLFGAVGYSVAFLMIFILILVLYRISLVETEKLKTLLPGALLTACVWFVSSELFSIYVSYFTRIQRLYGSLAGVVILLYWLKLNSFALLIGAELNSMLLKPRKPPQR